MKYNIPMGLYKHCMIDFESSIDGSLKRTLNYVHTQIMSTMTITNKDEGLYVSDNMIAKEDSFFKYYNNLVKNFFDKNIDDYTNAHIFKKENGYVDLLEYLKETCYLQSSISASILSKEYGDDVARVIFSKITDRKQESIIDDYQIMLMQLILGIEYYLIELYNHFEDKNVSCYEKEQLSTVFEHIVESNEEYVNGIMYINFALYDTNGLNIRNKLAHGNYKSGFKDLNIFIYVVVSWISASAICSRITGAKNGQ